jgi:hypothetical protein
MFSYAKTGGATDSGFQTGAGWFSSSQASGATSTFNNVVSRYSLTGGSVTNAQDFVADTSYAGGAAVANRMGFTVNDFGQPVVTQYGLYVTSLTSGTAANYAIYAAGSTPSYFGGNVGIGIAPGSGTKLAVNGKVAATEIVVTTSPGADYVFEPGYRLTPLGELAKYVEANRHLPGIPGADEMAAKGVDLAEMQAKLLAKIEELTLHMIRAEQENADLRKEVGELKRALGGSLK